MIKENFKSALRAAGKNYSDVARHLGISAQSVSEWVKKPTALKAERYEKVAKFLGVSASWLQFGNESELNRVVEAIELPLLQLNEVKRYLSGDLTDVPSFYFSDDVTANSFACRQSGDSMYSQNEDNSIDDDSIVVVEPLSKPIPNKIILFSIKNSNECFFKKYVIDAGHHYLVSLNGKFNTIEMNDSHEAIGVAKYAVKEKVL